MKNHNITSRKFILVALNLFYYLKCLVFFRNHPDKQRLLEYEQKWKEWEAQVEQRRQAIRKAKQSVTNANNSAAAANSSSSAINLFSQMMQQAIAKTNPQPQPQPQPQQAPQPVSVGSGVPDMMTMMTAMQNAMKSGGISAPAPSNSASESQGMSKFFLLL